MICGLNEKKAQHSKLKFLNIKKTKKEKKLKKPKIKLSKLSSEVRNSLPILCLLRSGNGSVKAGSETVG